MAQSSDSVTTQLGITYANHDGVELAGDLYLPKGKTGAPALVAVHGGGWVQGARSAFQYWGPYLASRGIAMFTISYRLATKGKTFPHAVQDVLAGVQFMRGKAGEFDAAQRLLQTLLHDSDLVDAPRSCDGEPLEKRHVVGEQPAAA